MGESNKHQPLRYIARQKDLYCPHCGICILTDLVKGGCPTCGGLINNTLPPTGRDCDNMDCHLCDYITGCLAEKHCNKKFLL